MKVLLEFKTHHYWENYEKGELYCPNCGEKEVWDDQGSGDYYEGPDHLCIKCGFEFTMPSGSIRKDEWSQIVDQIRAGVANKPKTPEGQ